MKMSHYCHTIPDEKGRNLTHIDESEKSKKREKP